MQKFNWLWKTLFFVLEIPFLVAYFFRNAKLTFTSEVKSRQVYLLCGILKISEG